MVTSLLQISVLFMVACADGPPETSLEPVSTTVSTKTSVADPVVFMYRSYECAGAADWTINLASSSAKHCQNCWDRCAEAGDSGAKSFRITGGASAAVAWNCIGSFEYPNANFQRGGLMESGKCHSPGGGGTVVLCPGRVSSYDILAELEAVCNVSVSTSTDYLITSLSSKLRPLGTLMLVFSLLAVAL